VRHLAKADLSGVLAVWEGLGYYSRARNLHRASRVILKRFHGKIPDTIDDLLTLPGIGRYTTGAILSIAYNKAAPILDGNVKRVLSRLFAVSSHPARGKTEGLLWHLSESLIPEGRANSFNQALMDLGSMVCTPKAPRCDHCPLIRFCKGKGLGDPEKYPLPKKKKNIPHIDAVAAVIQKNGKVLLNRRLPEGLLGGLWEFPNWRVHGKEDSEIKLLDCLKRELGIRVKSKEPIGSFKQAFSHFKLTLQTFHCSIMSGKGNGKWVSVKNLHLFPMSRIHRNIANQISQGLS
jgi:A/G-specific adenine glycosylase